MRLLYHRCETLQVQDKVILIFGTSYFTLNEQSENVSPRPTMTTVIC